MLPQFAGASRLKSSIKFLATLFRCFLSYRLHNLLPNAQRPSVKPPTPRLNIASERNCKVLDLVSQRREFGEVEVGRRRPLFEGCDPLRGFLMDDFTCECAEVA